MPWNKVCSGDLITDKGRDEECYISKKTSTRMRKQQRINREEVKGKEKRNTKK